jgi:hypothetical protein
MPRVSNGAMGSVVRWAVVGTGGIARRTIGDLKICANAELAAVCSRDQPRPMLSRASIGIPLSFGDFAELCASEEVDAIYIGIARNEATALLGISSRIRGVREALHAPCRKGSF